MHIQDFLSSLTLNQWILLSLGSILAGMNKAGLQGMTPLAVALFASAFGSRASTGIILPVLTIADLFALRYYHKKVQWNHIFRVLPWTLAGIVAGLLLGSFVSGTVFTVFLGTSVLLSALVLLWKELRKDVNPPSYPWFPPLMGVAGGFTTMVGNVGGPIISIYLLAMKLPKNNFLGTMAWFFFITNTIKIPLHVVLWKTINLQTLVLNLFSIPLIYLGAFLGYRLVRIIPEKPYRFFAITAISLAAIRLYFM